MTGMVVVRPVTSADRLAISALYHRLSQRSLYMRYFSAAVDVDRAVDDLVRRADEGEVAVALLDDELVGVASYIVLDDPSIAEFSVLVEDTHQHHGIGHQLIDHLAAHARQRGVTRFLAEVLTENIAMLHLCAHCGLPETAVMDGSVVDVALTLQLSDG
jgi:GNAT superfamily N-acetyltransferase